MTSLVQLNRLLDFYHEDKISHAYLIETNNIEECFKDLISIVKKINCPSTYKEECQECNLCNLLNNGYLPSFIVVEPDGKNIKKEQILDLKSRFSSIPTFTKENIYIIKGAESLNNSSANTMLKFLEEPEEHIIGFFLTNNINNVINTIKSRCEVIKIRYDNNENYDIFSNKYYDVVYEYLKKIETNQNIIINNRSFLLSKYNEREDIKEIFMLILRIYREAKKNKQCIDNQKFADNFSFLISQDSIELNRKEKLLLKYLEDINYNVNIELFVDKFVIELSGLNE